MRTVNIWIRKQTFKSNYFISTEYSDPYCYSADTESEAIKKFEEDRHVTVGKVYHF